MQIRFYMIKFTQCDKNCHTNKTAWSPKASTVTYCTNANLEILHSYNIWGQCGSFRFTEAIKVN